MDFLDYLTGLACEGETVLIVKQKPVLVDGKQQFHNDGAIKCTWPAFMPSRWKDGAAWYGNTALFKLDRMDDRISAAAANADYVAVLVCDDVGTKSKAPPVPPTWVMETSPDNYQWGYAFAEQPTCAEFSAAIIAIAAAGYTDKGAINPVRNFRLPGSINLKPQHNGFAARLVEFHPERTIELDSFCAALGVTPGEANTARMGGSVVADDGADDVLAWVAQRGELLERTNGQGWAGVVCPNAAEHTDGNPMGRYMPANRAYCCMHAHCCDWTSERYLQWVESEGGPSHSAGLRPELLASIMAPALAKINGMASIFSTTAATDIARVELQEASRAERETWFERFAYIETDDAYFDLESRREISRSTFNALFRHIRCTSRHSDKGKRVEASVWFDEHRQDRGGKIVQGLTYAAGDPAICVLDGLPYGNRWIDGRGEVGTGDVTRWLDHARKIIPTDFEREHIFDVMAFKLQHPRVKINHAILLAGNSGAGKDTFIAPFVYAVCGASQRNRALVDRSTFDSQFNYALESEIMIVNELRPDEFKDRRALENTLKPIIAAPPEYLTVNRKGMHPYHTANRLLVLAFSNYRDAIALTGDDRRWFVTWVEAARMTDAEGAAFWQWYKNGGMADVAGWLMRRDVSKFNPGATPPATESKAVMCSQARSPAEEYIMHAIETKVMDFKSGVIASPFFSICDKLQAAAPSSIRVTQSALIHALLESKWHDLGLVHSKMYPSKKRLFARADVAVTTSKSDLRAMVEQESASILPFKKVE